MSNITRRDFLKLVGATAAALAVPVIAESQQRLDLTVEVDQAKLEEAFYINPLPFWKADGTCYAEVTFDQAKMWQAVYATDQWGRHWTTPDGKAWTCGEDSFTL